MRHLGAPVLAAAFLAAVVLGVAAVGANQSLTATVGPGVLTLTDAGGASVTSVGPGTYVLTVDDRSQIHNFHLEGPRVSMTTSLEFTGTTTWMVALRDGVYTYSSDPQAGDLVGRLIVGTPPQPVLNASVTDSQITLKRADGATVSELSPGDYVIDVDDQSTSESFRLVGPGVEQHTQPHVRFHTVWVVSLQDGVYHYFSDRRPADLQGSVKVGTGAQPVENVLHAVTGTDFAISLVARDFAPLGKVAAGTYTIDVDDRSPDHNFRVSGPGVNVSTTLAEVGRKSFTVTLKPGSYSFLCDPHTLTMFATFTVPSSAVAARPLAARVSSGGKVRLTAAGRAVRSLQAGTYVVTVRDESRVLGFRLVGPGVRKATGARFRGTASWRVRLKTGTYRYGAGTALRTLTVR
jgi:plastocyanin